ncbi:MAG: universal stress protein [Chloroflexi bacterium]|nr:universal stress protein [Chloroflexota bacterium]
MYKKILCTLDGSKLAEQALPHAVALAKAFDADLILLRVVEPPPLPILPEFAGAELELLPELHKTAKAYIDRWVQELQEEGDRVSGVVEEGKPADVIADFAQEKEIDLIVMATHGRSGITRWAFGSVADRVLRSAGRPVLLIRARNDG